MAGDKLRYQTRPFYEGFEVYDTERDGQRVATFMDEAAAIHHANTLNCGFLTKDTVGRIRIDRDGRIEGLLFRDSRETLTPDMVYNVERAADGSMTLRHLGPGRDLIANLEVDDPDSPKVPCPNCRGVGQVIYGSAGGCDLWASCHLCRGKAEVSAAAREAWRCLDGH